MYLIDIKDETEIALAALKVGDIETAKECLAYINECVKILEFEEKKPPIAIAKDVEKLLRETAEECAFFCDQIDNKSFWSEFK